MFAEGADRFRKVRLVISLGAFVKKSNLLNGCEQTAVLTLEVCLHTGADIDNISIH